MKVCAVLLGSLLITTLPAAAQTKAAKPKPGATRATVKKLTREQGFVLQVVKSAVALSQPDPQDRLRVLNSASAVASTVDAKYASRLANEGVELEASLVANGQLPTVSIMASGRADCRAMKNFVEQLQPRSVLVAEQSLIGAISKCSSTTLESVRQKADGALEQGTIAPRLLMALMERTGGASPWSQQRFSQLFRSLPDPSSETSRLAAPDYAAMYSSLAPRIPDDLARSSGLKVLEWLARMEPSSERSVAVLVTAAALQEALGKEKYQQLLEGDVMVRQLVEAKGPPAERAQPEYESASVLRAMGGKGMEKQEDLRSLPPSLRAREAAAHGFARGIAQDRDSASTFFDIAFSAADEVWSGRTSVRDAPGIVEEVCEAAAQVDAVDALRRAQRLQDPTAQAIGMIAVARVVAGRSAR